MKQINENTKTLDNLLAEISTELNDHIHNNTLDYEMLRIIENKTDQLFSDFRRYDYSSAALSDTINTIAQKMNILVKDSKEYKQYKKIEKQFDKIQCCSNDGMSVFDKEQLLDRMIKQLARLDPDIPGVERMEIVNLTNKLCYNKHRFKNHRKMKIYHIPNVEKLVAEYCVCDSDEYVNKKEYNIAIGKIDKWIHINQALETPDHVERLKGLRKDLVTCDVRYKTRGNLAFKRGIKNLKKRKYSLARRYFNVAAKFDYRVRSSALNNIGVAWSRVGDYFRADNSFASAIKYDPNHATAKKNRAALHSIRPSRDNDLRLSPNQLKLSTQ